jgi:hypothetical protein
MGLCIAGMNSVLREMKSWFLQISSLAYGQTPLQFRMAREMTWRTPKVRWGCSECEWVFVPPGPPVGETLDEMTAYFLAQRDNAFASHVCTDNYPPG